MSGIGRMAGEKLWQSFGKKLKYCKQKLSLLSMRIVYANSVNFRMNIIEHNKNADVLLIVLHI